MIILLFLMSFVFLFFFVLYFCNCVRKKLKISRSNQKPYIEEKEQRQTTAYKPLHNKRFSGTNATEKPRKGQSSAYDN